MRFLIVACLIHVGFYSLLQAQPNCPICPVKQWDLPYGGSSDDYLTSIPGVNTSDTIVCPSRA